MAVSRFRQNLANNKNEKPTTNPQQPLKRKKQPPSEGRYRIESIVDKLEIKRRTEGLSVDGRDESVVDGRKDSFEEAKLAKGGEEEYAEKKEMRLTGFEPGIRPSIRRTLDRSDSRVRFDMN